MGGSLGRTEATGYGVIYTLREALKALKIDIASTTASLQGFGNVAEYAAKLIQLWAERLLLSPAGTIMTKAYTYRNPEGINIEQMAQIKDSFGTIDKQKAIDFGCELLEGEAWISQDVHPTPLRLRKSNNSGNLCKD